MGWLDAAGQWVEQKAEQQAERAAEEKNEKEAKKREKTPVGRAEAAKQNGEAFFQIELDIAAVGGSEWLGRASQLGKTNTQVRKSKSRPDLLGQIEEVGWHLEHVGYVYVMTGSTSSNRSHGTGQAVQNNGKVMGIYLFRNTD